MVNVMKVFKCEKCCLKANSLIVFYIIELQCYSLLKYIIEITDINSLNLLTTFVITYDSIHRDLLSHLLYREPITGSSMGIFSNFIST